MRFACVVTLVLLVALCGACSLPLASRRAQVLEPGELEVTAGASGGVLFSQAAVSTFSSSFVPAVGTNASVRFGLVPQLDLQVRLLDVFVPEVSVGWQLIGDAAKNDLAFTLTGGAGPVFGLGFSNAAGSFTELGLFVPLQALVDVPLGDGALTFAARAVTSGSRTDVAGVASYGLFVSPSVSAAWTVPFGDGFFVRPEIAGNVPVPVVTTGAQAAGRGLPGDGALVLATLAFGYEFRP